jgi:hypothetical protein
MKTTLAWGNLYLVLLVALITVLGVPSVSHAAAPTRLGWSTIPDTELRTVCADGNGFPQVGAISGCSDVYAGWRGGVIDAARNRLVMWGGGHGGYAGDEVYALDPNTAITSNTITLPGYNTATPIGASAGSSYSINGGAFVASAGTISPGQTVEVRQASTSAPSTVTGTAADTLQVGANKQYPTITAAVNAAQPGNTIEIDAGVYQNETITIAKDNLIFRGVGGRAHVKWGNGDYLTNTSDIGNGKGIFVIQSNNVVIENLEFSGSKVVDQNGAGIRYEGGNLTIRGSYFHQNENGILGEGTMSSTLLIENSIFERNGDCIALCAHNIYIGHMGTFIFRYNKSTDSKLGHTLKSRANVTEVVGNYFSTKNGTGSYEANFPNGGTVYFIGNVIEQGVNTDNSQMLAYGEEGSNNPNPALYVVNNTFSNLLGSDSFLSVSGSPVLTVVNNVFSGGGSIGVVANSSNKVLAASTFTNAAGGDYHLAPGSAAIDAGVNPGSAGAYNLTPQWEYVETAGNTARVISGAALDAGAYEFTTVGPDTTPDAFNFTPQTGAALHATVTSNTITPIGYNAATAISVSAGGSYSINGGMYVTTPGTLSPGQSVTVRLTTSGSNNAQTCATLTIGGVPGQFCATTQGTNTADFATRCAQPGVVKCVGFDNAADFDIGSGGTIGAYGQNAGILPPFGTSDFTRAVGDTSIKASGAGSLRFTIPSNSGADSSGSYFTNFSADLSAQFGAGQEFYVQWRQRFSPEFLNTVYAGGGGWKQVIVGTGDQPGTLYSSCSTLELPVQNTEQRGFPQMYNSCSGSASHGPFDPFEERFGAFDFKLQNARAAPFCLYSQSTTGYFPPNGNCFGYVANEWLTFQMRVQIGPRVGDEFVGSTITLWGARDGAAAEMLMQYGPYNLSAGSLAENQRYGKIWLLPYHTNKSSAQVHPAAFTWYDELIISTQAIAFPGAAPPMRRVPPNLLVK